MRNRVLSNRGHLLGGVAVASGVVLALTLVASSCGDTEGSASTSTTSKAPTAPTSTTTTKSTSTTTTTSTTAATGTPNPRITLRFGNQVVALSSGSCTSTGPTSLELDAADDSGNTLTIHAIEGVGSATYRGPSADREGSVRSVQVGADGTFSVAGIMSVADDSAPGPDDLAVTGPCA